MARGSHPIWPRSGAKRKQKGSGLVEGKMESLLMPRSLKPGSLLCDECELELISYLQLVSEGPQVVLEIILLR